MVLDPLRIRLGDSRGYAERRQEADDELVPRPRFLRQPAAGVGEKDGAVGLRGHEAGALQPLDRPIHGDMRDRETTGDVDDPRLPFRLDEVGDQLDIVLGELLRMVVARADDMTDAPRAGRSAL